jgi:hypothetical protein
METCSVCVEKFNKTGRFKIQCPSCQYVVCRSCYQRFCASKLDQVCMKCGKQHTLEFFRDAVSDKFYFRTWSEVRKKALFDYERAQFPLTQQCIGMVRDLEERISPLKNEVAEKRRELRQLRRTLKEVKRVEIVPPTDSSAVTGGYDAGCYPCPIDECRGIVQDHMCGICRTACCKDCRVPIGKDSADNPHVCDADVVKVVQMIREESKPCPRCFVPIFRIDGCSQMWCTRCNSGFNWETGSAIREDRIHNPHHTEWVNQRTEGIEQRVRVGGCMDGDAELYREVIQHLLRHPKIASGRNTIILRKILNNIEGTWTLTIGRLGATEEARSPRFFNKLRFKYLCGMISQVEYSKTLGRVDEHRKRLNQAFPIYSTLFYVLNDLLHEFYIAINENPDDSHFCELYPPLLRDIGEAVAIANNGLNGAMKRWKIKLYNILPDLSCANRQKPRLVSLSSNAPIVRRRRGRRMRQRPIFFGLNDIPIIHDH